MVATSYDDEGAVARGKWSTRGRGSAGGRCFCSKRSGAVDLVQIILEIEVDGWSGDPLQIVCRFVGSYKFGEVVLILVPGSHERLDSRKCMCARNMGARVQRGTWRTKV
jgi:hypothetical protein